MIVREVAPGREDHASLGVCLFTCGEVLRLDDDAQQEFTHATIETFVAAETHPGFVWRAEGTLAFDGDGTFSGVRYDAVPTWLVHLPVGRVLQTLSVWTDLESARQFAYHSHAHMSALRRRREWAARTSHPVYALWHAGVAHRPAWEEAVERIEALDARGPSADAFDFRSTQLARTDNSSQ